MINLMIKGPKATKSYKGHVKRKVYIYIMLKDFIKVTRHVKFITVFWGIVNFTIYFE